jgi:CubicO group peptidase (beta-lactamase class C family)
MGLHRGGFYPVRFRSVVSSAGGANLKQVLRVAVGITFLLVSRLASGQTPSAPPTDLTERVDKLFEKWNRTDSPGCAVSVMKDGRIIYKHGYGMADLDHNVTITPLTVFHVASMSKQFTAASILMLAQQGKLWLDDDVRKYIPELPDFGSLITIRHLIYHTSGLRDQWNLLDLAGWRYSLDLITDDDVMSVLMTQKDLNFKPGEKHVYCNTGYTLMAIIVKRVSGMSFREFTTKNIFEPLGMTHTFFRDDHAEIVKNNAYGYESEKGNPFRLGLTNFDTAGATSLHTTVEDLALWDENFYHPRVGGPSFREQMLQRGKLNNGETLDYAFGLVVGKYKGLPTEDHGGADAGYHSDMTRFPEQHFSVAVLCNDSETSPSSLVRSVADLYLAQDLKAPEPSVPGSAAPGAGITLTEQQLAGLQALYWNRDDDQFVKIYLKDAKLRVSFDLEDDYALKPVSETLFHIADTPWGDQANFHFEPAAGDKPHRLMQGFGDAKPDVFEVVPPSTPTAGELADYAGNYVSQEIEPVYRMVIQDGKLMLTRLKHKPAPLEPRTLGVFTAEIGTVRFTRDSNHRVSGFVLNSGRIRNFRFTRRVN